MSLVKVTGFYTKDEPAFLYYSRLFKFYFMEELTKNMISFDFQVQKILKNFTVVSPYSPWNFEVYYMSRCKVESHYFTYWTSFLMYIVIAFVYSPLYFLQAPTVFLSILVNSERKKIIVLSSQDCVLAFLFVSPV